MSLNWFKNTKNRQRKHIKIKDLAIHYKVHRNTMSKICKGVDLYDFWECVHLVKRLDRSEWAAVRDLRTRPSNLK